MNEQRRAIFNTLYTEYNSMVLQLCLGFMNGDRNLATDLMQDIFINIWNALPGYRAEATHKTWIYRITVNTCLQYIRKQKNKKNIPAEGPGAAILAAGETVPAAEYDDLYKAISQLSDVDRLIIMMVLDEMEYEEISKITGISNATLRVKIHRIKERLKKIMEHE